MDQRLLYEALTRAGFQVLEFVDRPASFGSWSVNVKVKHKEFRLAFDGRDKALTLQLAHPGTGWADLKLEKAAGPPAELIALGLAWLQECLHA
jgi:hypothetical protein